ncbi:MAG: hypothetical protein ACREJW_00110 [Candidatus Methylomirabilales bacterium]
MHKPLSQFALNALKLADHIETLDPGDFDMTDCGRCVAGHCLNLFDPTWRDEPFALGISPRPALADHLGISERDTHRIYYCIKANRTEAITMLRTLALTGEVSWGDTLNQSVSLIDQTVGA